MEIYLDNAATTKPINGMLEAIKPYIETNWHNPSSLYSKSVNIKNKIEEVRNDVATLIGADSEEIFFTSGASESNNWVIRSFDDDCISNGDNSIIITTPIEHSSILDALENPALMSDYWFCKVNKDGFIDLDNLKTSLELAKHNNMRILVSVMFANNEIGTIQRIKEISKLVHSYNGVFHSDCTQALPHIEIDVKELGIDFMTASSHKLGGLKGTGILYKSKDIELSPLIYGEQERELRGGTENVIGIVALGEAIKGLYYDKANRVSKLRDYFIGKLEDEFGCTVNGSLENRLPNNANVTFPQNVNGESLLYMLELDDIFISTGSACNSKSIKPSHVLKAIGLSDEDAMKTVRMTLPYDITKYEIDKVIESIGNSIRIMELN